MRTCGQDDRLACETRTLCELRICRMQANATTARCGAQDSCFFFLHIYICFLESVVCLFFFVVFWFLLSNGSRLAVHKMNQEPATFWLRLREIPNLMTVEHLSLPKVILCSGASWFLVVFFSFLFYRITWHGHGMWFAVAERIFGKKLRRICAFYSFFFLKCFIFALCDKLVPSKGVSYSSLIEMVALITYLLWRPFSLSNWIHLRIL